MKTYEKESLLKSFTLFFSVQLIFLSIVIYQHYSKVLHEYDMHIGNAIMQCHLNEQCDTFKTTSLTDVKDKKLHTFYKNDTIYMLFKNNDNYIKVSIAKNKYLAKQSEIEEHVLFEYLLYFIALVLESLFFALFAMRPLKVALQLNEEFVKDILHDFNTPLSSLKINLKILHKKFGNDDALTRSNEAIQNILSLQDNLHYYISQSKLQNQRINLQDILEKKIVYFKNIFPNLKIQTKLQDTMLYVNKDVIERIIDNLISNACKYNKTNGEVFISLQDYSLKIQDTGIGIKNPEKIFQRHYKENVTGIGIGLHIVKKLCDELNIKISLQSTISTGTLFTLDLKMLKI